MSQADLTMGAHSAGMVAEPPFSMPTKKLAMWLFIIADTMTFAACLVAYGFLRVGTPTWPRPFHSITNVADHDLHPAEQQFDHDARSAIGKDRG